MKNIKFAIIISTATGTLLVSPVQALRSNSMAASNNLVYNVTTTHYHKLLFLGKWYLEFYGQQIWFLMNKLLFYDIMYRLSWNFENLPKVLVISTTPTYVIQVCPYILYTSVFIVLSVHKTMVNWIIC